MADATGPTAGCSVALTCQDARSRAHLEPLVAKRWGDAEAAVRAVALLSAVMALGVKPRSGAGHHYLRPDGRRRNIICIWRGVCMSL